MKQVDLSQNTSQQLTQRFISFEGTDGCGKSTQIAMVKAYLEEQGHRVICTREPGSTSLGEKIRKLLLDPANDDMKSGCELLLYEAARAQLVDEVIMPALSEGAWVLSDRYADSTYAYQCAGRGLTEDTIKQANELGTRGVWPGLTVVLAIPVREALKRADNDHQPDRLEAEGVAFQEAVLAGYQRLAQMYPERVHLVDARGDQHEVFARITNLIQTHIRNSK